MQSKVFSILLLALFEGACFAEITIDPLKQSKFVSHLIDATVQVETSCYGERAKAIGVHGDRTGLLIRALLSKDMFPVISIDNATEVYPDPVWDTSPYKLQLFTIVADSTTQLQRILDGIKNSPWWNHMASFFILNWTIDEANHDCSNAFDFLRIAWQMNLLNVNFLCIQETEKVLLYTFNPYTDKAPNTWKLKKTFRGKHDHPWSMFVQELQEDKDVCGGLDFDKATDLGAYKISASARDVPQFWSTNPNNTGIDSFEELEGLLWQILFRSMNADVELKKYSENATFIDFNNNGEATGLVLDASKKTSDIVLNSYYQEVLMNLTVTYPHWNTGLGIVTQRNGYLSQLSKINSVIDVSSRYGLCAVILLTIIFFKFFVRLTLMTAVLNTLRVTCNSALPRVPKTTAMRIYLGALFFFQITILALYQGQLASLLTKEVEKKNVNTMQDLIDGGYTTHGHKGISQYFRKPEFNGSFIGHSIDDCKMYVLGDRSAACVEDWDIVNSDEMPSGLHLSTDMIIPTALEYAIREDWPLEKRVNEILGRMMAGDIIRRTYTVYSEKVSRISKFKEQMRSNEGPKVLTLRQLSFAFAILAVGLGCAFVAFIVEIIIW